MFSDSTSVSLLLKSDVGHFKRRGNSRDFSFTSAKTDLEHENDLFLSYCVHPAHLDQYPGAKLMMTYMPDLNQPSLGIEVQPAPLNYSMHSSATPNKEPKTSVQPFRTPSLRLQREQVVDREWISRESEPELHNRLIETCQVIKEARHQEHCTWSRYYTFILLSLPKFV